MLGKEAAGREVELSWGFAVISVLRASTPACFPSENNLEFYKEIVNNY